LSVPPNIFLSVATLVGKTNKSENGWNRIVIEKPFGRDLKSFEKLSKSLNNSYSQDEIFRIDHYMYLFFLIKSGKEVVQNLLVLRFGNVIFDPLWNRNSIKSVQIVFKVFIFNLFIKEDIGVEGIIILYK
jgi:glucose-6-phosphate 1-dehydrogenase